MSNASEPRSLNAIASVIKTFVSFSWAKLQIFSWWGKKNAVTIRLQVFLKSVKLGIYKNAPATTSKSTCPTSLFRHAPRRSTDVGHVGFLGGESMPRVYEEYQRRNEHWRHWQSRRIAGLFPLSYKDDVLPMGIWMIICGLIRILRKMKKKWKHDSAFGFLCYLCNKSKLFVGVADRMGDW